MLPLIHTTLASLLHDRGQIPPGEVDVLFEIPSRAWVESLPRPAVCCYLFDMAEVTEYRNASAQVNRANGRAITQLAPRRVDLRYLVCAFSSARADEQELIWRAMAVLLKHTALPPELMPKELRELDVPVTTKLGAYPEAPKLLDLWGALDLPPRPALLLTVTAPMDLRLSVEAPLVLSRTVRLARPDDDATARGEGIDPERVTRRDKGSREPLDGVVLARRALHVEADGETRKQPIERHLVGGVVRDAAGNPLEGLTVRAADHAARCVTGKDGRFRLENLDAGPTKLIVSLEPKDDLVVRRELTFAARDPEAAARAAQLVPAPIEFDVEVPRSFDLDVERRVVLHHVHGGVTDDGGQPIPGAEIGVEGEEKPIGTTDREGRFTLALPAGQVRLWVRRTADGPRATFVVTVPGPAITLIVTEPRPAA